MRLLDTCRVCEATAPSTGMLPCAWQSWNAATCFDWSATKGSTCRYGLETAESPAAAADQEGSEAAEAQASQNGAGSGRRHLSAKERKLLKKVTRV